MDRDPPSCSLAHRTRRGLVTACVRKRQRKARRLRAAVVTASPGERRRTGGILYELMWGGAVLAERK